MTAFIAILGSPDPEMERIETLLRIAGVEVQYATSGGKRVHAGNAYQADGLDLPVGGRFDQVLMVECGFNDTPLTPYERGLCPPPLRGTVLKTVVIDHHRDGDPGAGKSPAEFLAGSSLGQVVSWLASHGMLSESDWLWEEASCPDCARLGGMFVADPDIGYEPIPGAKPGDRDPITGVYLPTTRARFTGGRWAVVVREAIPYGCEGGWDYEAGRALVIPQDLVLAAASDHCPAAAYRGECPGVSPEALMKWRAATRAAFQKRPVGEVLADVERATAALRGAPELILVDEESCPWCVVSGGIGCGMCQGAGILSPAVSVKDMRGVVIPELPEAALRLGVGYIAGPLVGPDGRKKITCSGSAEQVEAFLQEWAPSQGLVGLYPDLAVAKARGFAGGYLP